VRVPLAADASSPLSQEHFWRFFKYVLNSFDMVWDDVQLVNLWQGKVSKFGRLIARGQFAIYYHYFKVQCDKVILVSVGILDIPIRIGVEAGKSLDLDLQSRFFPHLTYTCFSDRFSRFHLSTWKTPLVIISPTSEQHLLSGFIENDG
jgi:hypothetical protein